MSKYFSPDSKVEGRQWIEDLLYYLLETDQIDYVYALHEVECIAVHEPFAFYGDLPVPAAVTLDETGRLLLLIYYPLVSRLPFEARLVIMKHEIIHIIDGHLSSYGLDIRKVYGPQIAQTAFDLYVNQRIDVEPLEKAGLQLLRIDQFGFPPDLSSMEYAELLKDLADQGKLSGFTEAGMVSPDGRVINSDGKTIGEKPCEDPQAGTAGEPGDEFTGKGKYRATEVFDITEKEAAKADQATKEIRHNVESSLQADKKTWSRGFDGADAKQFVKALERPSTVPWSYYLRVMETGSRAETVVPTRRRLSRRSPFHLGRVRRYSLNVVVLVDTSGSMGSAQLRLVDPELRGLHFRGADILVIHSDAKVVKVHPYSPFECLEEFHGRGGTDFSDALLRIRELYPAPGLFVAFTDGYGGAERYVATIVEERGRQWYDDYVASDPLYSPDGIESLWLLPEGSMTPEAFKKNVIPWGNVVVIPAS